MIDGGAARSSRAGRRDAVREEPRRRRDRRRREGAPEGKLPGSAREPATLSERQRDINAHGLGRELFGGMRRSVLSAEEGAITWL